MEGTTTMGKLIAAIILGAFLGVFVMLALGYDKTLAASFAQNARTVSHIVGTMNDATATGGGE
jgi:hypothetical protein